MSPYINVGHAYHENLNANQKNKNKKTMLDVFTLNFCSDEQCTFKVHALVVLLLCLQLYLGAAREHEKWNTSGCH